MGRFGQYASTSPATRGSSAPRRNEFHLSGKPYFSFNGSNFKAQNPRGSDPRSSHTNLENGLDYDVKFRMIVRRIGAGLENLGNTCFLNSVLQCLTYTEPLVAYLLSGKHQNSCHVVGFCALCSIQNHVIRARDSTGRILAPKDLVTNLRRISRNFRNARQEDAHEYMVHLLESMHKCCLPSGVPYESPNAYEKSLVHKIFGGSLRSQVKCMQCSYCSNKFDPFLDLSLEIVKADSLYKALNHFTAAEQLDGGEKQYMCQQCKQKVRAVKQLTIDKAPYVLTVHLKRFDSISGQKIDKKVQFSPILNLKPYVCGSNEGELKYTLYGVLVHAGWSTHSGHYYCFVRTSSGIWYSLDDNRVRQVCERTVLEQKAYMLFYVRDGINFGAGNIASAIQSQKMGPATMPNGSCSATTRYRYTPIDKPVNATAQKEKAVATAVENGLCSTSVTCQGFQNKSDGKSVIGVGEEKVGATTVQKRSGEKDYEGRLESSSPAKKIRTTDASIVLVQHNLPNVHLLEKNLSKEDSLQKSDSKDSSQLSMESKGNDSNVLVQQNLPIVHSLVKNLSREDSLLKSDGKDLSQSSMEIKGNVHQNLPMVHSSEKNMSKEDCNQKPDSKDLSQSSMESKCNDSVKCSAVDPPADNVIPKVIQHVTSVTSNDKSMKTDLLVSVAKPSEQPADIVVEMVQNTLDKAGGAPEETAAKQSVESNVVGRSNGAVVKIDELVSKASNHSSHQKPKKKAVKYKFPSMHLGTRILYGASISLQKRKKKHTKLKKEKQKLDVENLMDEKSEPSTSHATAAIEVSSKISRKKPRHSSKRSRTDHVKYEGISVMEDFVAELNRRTASGNIVLAGDDQCLKSEEMRQQQDEQISNVKDSMKTENRVADKPTNNHKRVAVEKCNGIELSSSQKVEVHETASVSIGYVADEWDEEYYRGKRKKVRMSKDTVGGPNPFQKIATTKAVKLKGKRKPYYLANQPFRIL